MPSNATGQTSDVSESRPWLKHYDFWVPGEMNFPRRPIHQILSLAALQFGDRPAVEAEPEDRRQEDPEPGQAEADQLGMVVRVRPRLLLAAALFELQLAIFRPKLLDRLRCRQNPALIDLIVLEKLRKLR